MPTRREFFSQTASAGGALALGAARSARPANKSPDTGWQPLKILVLGGTGFIGPYFVRTAVERGHRVSVFNRGRRQAQLPATVQWLIGDRDGDLRALEGRDWDLVVDLSVRLPVWVRTVGEVLRGHVTHYTFISSGAVYKRTADTMRNADERSEVLEYDLEADPYSRSNVDIQAAGRKRYCTPRDTPEACLEKASHYGSLKLLCEREAEKQFPGATLILRPSYIVGPGDPNGFFTYWLTRLAQGGDILAPGDPLQPVRFIDVRDLADWVIRMAEKRETGVYNVSGPGNSMSMCEMLGGIRGLFGVPMKLNWVSAQWSPAQDIVDAEAANWNIWQFSSDDAYVAYNSDKAVAKGLTYHPLSSTATETLNWYRSLPESSRAGWVTGIGVDDIATLRVHRIVTPWPEILQREKDTLARWRAHRASI